MGLAIDGDTVHGLAIGGQAFFPEENAGMPNLIGQAIDWKTMPDDKMVHLFALIYQDSTPQRNIPNAFQAVATQGQTDDDHLSSPSGWNSIYSTIYAETILPPTPDLKSDNPIYRAKNTLFLGIYYSSSDSDDHLQVIVKPSDLLLNLPVMLWVKYDDVKNYILTNGAPTDSN